MAAQTCFFLQRRVNHDLVELVLLMAAKADRVAGGTQQMGLIRGMRVMAVNAFPAFQGRMDAFFVHPDLLGFVAGHAELVAFFFQKQLGQYPVPQMAILAFLFFDDGVHIFLGKVFAFKIGMTIKALLSGELAGGTHGHRNTGYNTIQGKYANGYCRNGNLIHAEQLIPRFHQAFDFTMGWKCKWSSSHWIRSGIASCIFFYHFDDAMSGVTLLAQERA
jgi:hypothetical protein